MQRPHANHGDNVPAEFRTDLASREVLNLGCGKKHMPNAVNVDRVRDVSPDIVVDLDRTPWPFPANRFQQVFATDVLEHLHDTICVMEEIHRICHPGAVVHLVVPHFSCDNAYTDITHRRFFTQSSFNYFTGENDFDFYTRCRFRRLRSHIQFRPTLLNKIVWRVANRYPTAYEARWAWMFPAWFLAIDLEVVKPP